MSENPIYEVTSHIEGKNARVRIYPDRIEWERGKSLSGGKMTAAIITFGMSAAVTGGVSSRKGSGTEMIPMRSISSVTTRHDTFSNDVVSIVTSGNTIDLRCSRAEAAQLKSLILQGINGTLVARPAAPAYGAPAAGKPSGIDALKARVMQGINDVMGDAPGTASQPVPSSTAPPSPPPPPPPPPPVESKPADWYQDPKGEARLRYWDGMAWTDHTAP